MKKFLIATALIISSLTCKLYAQPQWKFHIAFEDATGAKDTIWLIYDITATSNLVDSALGEGPTITNTSVFNVWLYNVNFDSTKTWASPYNYKTITTEIRAFNVVYPMIVRWDTSLYHSPVLPSPFNFGRIDNDYFFLVNNNIPLQAYDPMLTDTAYCPLFTWGSQYHFPFYFLIERDHIYAGIRDFDNELFNLFPMPFSDKINITLKRNETVEVNLFDVTSRKIFNQSFTNSTSINTEQLAKGIYLYEVRNKKGVIKKGKVVKD